MTRPILPMQPVSRIRAMDCQGTVATVYEYDKSGSAQDDYDSGSDDMSHATWALSSRFNCDPAGTYAGAVNQWLLLHAPLSSPVFSLLATLTGFPTASFTLYAIPDAFDLTGWTWDQALAAFPQEVRDTWHSIGWSLADVDTGGAKSARFHRFHWQPPCDVYGLLLISQGIDTLGYYDATAMVTISRLRRLSTIGPRKLRVTHRASVGTTRTLTLTPSPHRLRVGQLIRVSGISCGDAIGYNTRFDRSGEYGLGRGGAYITAVTDTTISYILPLPSVFEEEEVTTVGEVAVDEW